ncbi:uncharacterized protein [Diabrotica undecimpunctata]|uniref:uncharacterized protein isoform X3 n=1 Tax=Diabrotica undecimpunctata TaxID=50387 RepID=UPI003B63C611
MNRPLGLWILLSAGVLWLSTQDVHGKRATALIFAKTTTTTTTSSTTAASDEIVDSSEEEVDSTEANAEGNGNSTKPHLTGIPQIDYIYDPNLPKELNGYNLSDYPFYERVPENITFKCDGLHDGFYASVLHKCQVYHHCLFGIRYDFLCANYTAFDQTLFNCNFVSNVDCENSKKFWNRNDDLYKTKSTTPPPVVYSFYTQSPPVYAPPGSLIRRVPQRRGPVIPNLASIPEAPLEPLPPVAIPTANEAPIEGAINQPAQIPTEVLPEPRRRTRPAMRVRPYYEYYDDYEEPPRYVRKRPRPRPYYEEDYEYYDDRYYRRNDGGRRRRPYDRPMRRYKGRRDRYEDDEEYDEDYDKDDRYAVEDDSGKRKTNRGGTASSSSRYNSRRKPTRTSQSTGNPSKSPVEDEYEEYDDRVTSKRPKSEPTRNRNMNRRPNLEDDDEQYEQTNYKRNRKGGSTEIPLDESKTIIRPTSGTIFDRPRVAPKINLPVPKNVADKYSYKTMSMKTKDDAFNEEDSEESIFTEKPQAKISSSTEIPNATTVRGNFKRTFMQRRPTAEGKSTPRSTGRKVELSQPNESDEINQETQESKVNKRQPTVKVKTLPSKESVDVQENTKKDVRRSESQDRLKAIRVNMFKSRHSLSTPEVIDVDDLDDITEIDDSINEA